MTTSAALLAAEPVAPAVSADGQRPMRWRRPLSALLRVPLAGKLAGANALVAATAAATLALVHHAGAGRGQMIGVTIGALAASLVINLVLVSLALRPVGDLEEAAARVSRGDLAARVASSPFADAEMQRVASTFNALLDQFMADRARVRQLAAQVIRTGEEERMAVARELHDSTAQTLAALALQASTALHGGRDPGLVRPLELIRDLAVQALEDVRTLSQTIHSAVLDDLGLPAALEQLVRLTREQTGVEAVVDASGRGADVPRPVASVFYFVAREAVRNAVHHGQPRNVFVTLTAENGFARLEVEDDGRGFDPDEAARRRPAGALFAMRERAALVDGMFEVESAPGGGTRVVALVPIAALRSCALRQERL
jgi:signal transduction histidine kinase